ncbi:MAG: nucleoside deaminase [Alphaproteobacteria bacterium]|nr:nucleoside deaminase [Alphaproteobacteria bacterium]
MKNDFLNDIIKMALKNAKHSGINGEIPVCAVIFDPINKTIISSAENRTEIDHDPTAHAEILAIRKACEKIGDARLPNFDIYVTLEPCPMCATAISFARLKRLYFGAYDEKGGGVDHGCRVYDSKSCLHKPEVYGGFGEIEAKELLKDFFKGLR